jgi:serine/threonine protein kinase
MTGETGSTRYMAPEVAESRPYSEKADVYSFAMVMWEMATLRKPYEVSFRWRTSRGPAAT